MRVQRGDVVDEGDLLVDLEPGGRCGAARGAAAARAAARATSTSCSSAARCSTMRRARRCWPRATRRAGARARENVADLLDAGSLLEYGAFAVAAQRSRRSLDDLQRNTPADGLITGTGSVQCRPSSAASARAVAVMAYDYTVLAGTQGYFNHRKSDRLLELAAEHKLPLVLFAEGGGGRPGDVDSNRRCGLHCTTFQRFARCRARCRWWASSKAAASPATRRCWAAAT